MGFQDNFPRMRVACSATFGRAVTYIPVTAGLDPFETTMILENFALDSVDTHVLRDTLKGTMMHSVLATAGLSAPVHASNTSSGDSVQFLGIDGSLETWTVVDSEPDMAIGNWTLTLENRLRITP